MTTWKVRFLESAILGQGTKDATADEVLIKCIELAYKDMMTAGRYYSKNFSESKNVICNKTKKIIAENAFSFSRSKIDKVSRLFFDSEQLRTGNGYVTRYGLAQKLVNMSFKYLYVFSDRIFNSGQKVDFSNCDCPLDSIILEKGLNYKKCKWSRLSQEHYLECQELIKNRLRNEDIDFELKQLGNLAFDFIIW
ncbi:hypothetical protein LJB83_02140 [Clostridia bacterium OttesenSCG-928-F22]|nr:hypothetical protein [Clostridia bacterium OttesenSCG-928-F22]